MRRKTSTFTQLVAMTCAATTACFDPGGGGSRPTEWKGFGDPVPPILVDELLWSEPNDLVPAHEVGTLPGQMSVSHAGKPQYSIPLRVPEGRNGIQPSLAISFGGSTSNGLLGVGWQLTGLSRIAPCRRTIAIDGAPAAVGFRTGDQYCLDGARLIPVSGAAGDHGTIYRTEEDRFLRIESLGSVPGPEFTVPERFVAHHPDGQRWIYGKRLTAKQTHYKEPTGGTPLVREVVWSWALERVEDRLGNSMTIEYEDVPAPAATGTLPYQGQYALEVYPRRIRYTSHDSGLPARRVVELYYEDRPDPIDTYVSGIHVHTGKRLRSIEMRAPNPDVTQTVWYYELTYQDSDATGRSLLDSVRICDGTKRCLPPTRVIWSHGNDAYTRTDTGITLHDTYRLTNLMPGDFDGDGKADLLFWKGVRDVCMCADSACTEVTYGGSPWGPPCPELDAFAVDGEWTIASGDGVGGFGAQQGTGLRSTFATRADFVADPGSGDPDEYNPPLVADFDGDGTDDLLAARTGEIRSPAKGYALLQDVGSTLEGLPPFWEADVRYLADLDGDGRVDLFTNLNRPVPSIQWTPEGGIVSGWTGPDAWDEYAWGFRLGAGSPGFGAVREPGIKPYMSRYDQDLAWHSVDPRRLSIALDVEGDGRTDLLLPQPDNRYLSLQATSAGAASVSEVNLTYLWPGVGGVTQESPYSPVYLDINGDGLRDLVAANGVRVDSTGELQLPARINTGNGFGPWYLASVGPYLPPEEQRSAAEIAADMSTIGDPDATTTHQFPQPPMVDDGVRVFDANGDGRHDLLVPTKDGPIIYVSDGRRFHPQPATFELTHPVSTTLADGRPRFLGWTHRFADLDGDGLADLVQYDQVSDQVVTWRRAGPMPDQLVTVINGLDRVETVVMRPLSEPKLYTPGTGCTYPQRCLRSGGYVVSLLSRSNAAGNQDHLFYTYEDARTDVIGRGFLGFGRRHIEHVELGSRTSLEYDHAVREHGAYPLAGRVARSRTARPLGDGRTVVETEAIDRKRRWTFGGRVYVVRPAGTVRRVYEFDGPVGSLAPSLARRSEEVDQTWDDYGNLTHEERRRYGRVVPEGGGTPVHVEGERRVVEIDWDNHEAPWLLGIRRRVAETSYAPPPVGGSETRETRYVPDEHGRIEQILVEPNDPTLRLDTTLHYGAYGELEAIVKESSPDHPETGHQARTEKFVYGEERLYPKLFINALGHETQVHVHPALGAVVRAEDANGFRIRTTYDAFGRERWTAHAGGHQVWTSYEAGFAGPYVERVRTSAGAEHTTEYNRAGAPIKFTEKAFDGSWTITEQRYDDQGNVAERTNAFIDYADRRWTTYEYDGLGRPIEINSPDGSQVRHAYTPDEKRSWDRRGNESYVRTDVDGNLVVSANVLTDPESPPLARTRYEYGPFGRLRRVIDANGNVRTSSFDRRGRAVTLDDPDQGLRELRYNAFGEVVFEEDPVGRAAGVPVRYQRDALGRVEHRSAVDGDQKFTWDTTWIGNRAHSASADGIETESIYDTHGRLSRQRTFVGGEWHDVDYTYDGASRLAQIHYPEVPGLPRFSVRFAFGANGALAAVVDAGTGKPLWRAIERNAAGQTTRAELGASMRSARTYEPDTGHLEQIASEAYQPLTGTWKRILDLSYRYDRNGNVTSRTDAVTRRAEKFAYDSLDRLAAWRRQAHKHPVYETTYRYDLLGNLARRDLTGTGVAVVEHFDLGADGGGPNALGRYRRVSGGTTVADTLMSYDPNGRRVAGPAQEIAYNSFDLPRHIATDEGTTVFGYTADQERVFEMTSTSTTARVAQLYEKRKTASGIEHLFLVPNDEGVFAQVFHEQGSGTTQLYYVHRDHLGSTALVTDATGGSAKRQWFTPFGDRVAMSGLPTYGTAAPAPGDGFTGHRPADGQGLIDMNGRFYDSVSARFLSPDPLVAHPFFGQGLNRYAYVLNNPLKYRDPSGFVPEWDAEVGMWFEETFGPDGVSTGYTWTLPEDNAAGERAATEAGDRADDAGPPAPTSGEAARGRSPTREVVSRVERLRWDIHLDYWVAGWNEESERVTYTRESRRVGSVTISVNYSRDSDGRRDAWFDPRADVDIELLPTPVAPQVSVDGGVRRIGAVPEIYFTIQIDGARGTATGGQSTTRNSGSLQLQVGGDGARLTSTSPSQSTATSHSRSTATGNSYTATGRIRVPLTPGYGPHLLRAPTLPSGAALGYEDPELSGIIPSPRAYIRLSGPTWTVEGTYRHRAPRE